MPIKFALVSKSFLLQFALVLLTLLYKISTAINNFGCNQSPLVHLTGSLNCFNESIDYLHAQRAAVAIDELLFVDCQHLSNVRDKIERTLIGNAVLQDLLTEEVLHLGVMTFTEELQETQHAHAAIDALCLSLVDEEHLVN